MQALLTAQDIKGFIKECVQGDRTLDKQGLMSYLNISPYKYRRLMQLGMPYIKGPRKGRKYLVGDVESWIERNGIDLQAKTYKIRLNK